MKKNFLAFLLGLLMTVILFAGLEIFFRIFPRQTPITDPLVGYHKARDKDSHVSKELLKIGKKDRTSGVPAMLTAEEGRLAKREGADRSDLGPTNCCILQGHITKNNQFRSRIYTLSTRKLIYDVQFTFDSFGARLTPSVKNPKKQILMFGDSFTIGEGVNDEETSAYRLGELRPDSKVFNLGLSAGSPNQLLFELTRASHFRIDNLPRRKTIALYTYMDDHLERLFCRTECVGPDGYGWRTYQPYYELNKGEFHFKGDFHQRRVTNFFYSLFAKSAIAKFFNLAWPPRFDQASFDGFALMMKQSERALKKQFGDDLEFYVVMFPGFSGYFSTQLAEACRNQGLKVLDYGAVDVYSASEAHHEVPGDGHPSPLVHYLFAYLLNRDLPQ